MLVVPVTMPLPAVTRTLAGTEPRPPLDVTTAQLPFGPVLLPVTTVLFDPPELLTLPNASWSDPWPSWRSKQTSARGENKSLHDNLPDVSEGDKSAARACCAADSDNAVPPTCATCRHAAVANLRPPPRRRPVSATCRRRRCRRRPAAAASRGAARAHHRIAVAVGLPTRRRDPWWTMNRRPSLGRPTSRRYRRRRCCRRVLHSRRQRRASRQFRRPCPSRPPNHRCRARRSSAGLRAPPTPVDADAHPATAAEPPAEHGLSAPSCRRAADAASRRSGTRTVTCCRAPGAELHARPAGQPWRRQFGRCRYTDCGPHTRPRTADEPPPAVEPPAPIVELVWPCAIALPARSKRAPRTNSLNDIVPSLDPSTIVMI